MRGVRLGVVAASAALVLFLGTAGAADAATDTGSSCWADLTTGESLCVANGTDLVSAVAEQDGVQLIVPAGTIIGGAAAPTPSRDTAEAAAPDTATVLSIIYSGTGYSGSSFVMSVSGGSCSTSAYGYTSLSAIGWNDRASSYESFAGCTTALFAGSDYSGSSTGYHSDKSSLGSLNGATDSWRVSG